ncbi:MAG TPA: glycoside hydrolase family 35 protein [Candidatus Limnocylindrales bacterium]|nr:glycoside hydrolase family 35 protein [Candidatus Limnocylindrales bacterium]
MRSARLGLAAVLTAVIALALLGAARPRQTATRHTFGIEERSFILDGKPFEIISGEMHYERIPPEYWRDRLKKARAMGLNTISTYVFWNVHEPKEGTYDFSGQYDVATFIRDAQEEGLYVILRPGPYSCAEWDLGGFPAWLLSDPGIVLRSNDPKFMVPARRWLKRLGQELAPLQIARGGPIIAVQVENEYGSFDRDKEYLGSIRDALVNAGFGQSLLYTADGPEELPAGTLPNVPPVVNFGPGDAPSAFKTLANFRPDQPLMAGEYWDGWFDAWGLKHHGTDAAQQEKELDWILTQGYSINLYMFHGGTSFGFMNGANLDKTYMPQTTSYDYDAPLDESGRPTKKYFAFREIIAWHRPGVTLPPVPSTPAPIAIAPVALSEASPLWDNLAAPLMTETPKPMETLGQSYGYILYRTRLAGPAEGELKIHELRDYAEIFLNRKLVGTLDRRLGQDSLRIEAADSGVTLDILVENLGRINFSRALRDERKGITESVSLDGRELQGWEIYPLPMNDVESVRFARQAASGPALYRGTFTLRETGDTFLDTRALGKGAAWINGHALGRFWRIGPQQTLYVPGPWLVKGKNEIIVFDLDGSANRSVRGLTRPILDELRPAAAGAETAK